VAMRDDLAVALLKSNRHETPHVELTSSAVWFVVAALYVGRCEMPSRRFSESQNPTSDTIRTRPL
jgi:hypothetical protein